MKIIRFSNIDFIPASHEDKQNPGALKKILFGEKDFPTKGKISMINWARLPKGKSFRAHYHQDMDEVFVILSGKVKIIIGSEEEVLEKGDAVIVPTGKVHRMDNLSNKDVDYIVIGLSYRKGGKTVVVDDS